MIQLRVLPEGFFSTIFPPFVPRLQFYYLRIVRGNGDVENPERLECKEVVKKWQFVRQNGSQTETVIIGKINGVQEKITVYCVAKSEFIFY